MKPRHLLAALLLLTVPRPLASQSTEGDSATPAADTLFARWRGFSTPGCAARVDRSGRTLFRRAYGMANLETDTPNSPRTVFLAASIAKQVTAMAVLLLAREQRLSLDDDIHKFIPELPDYRVPITVRQLMTHTSGLRDYFETLILARGRFEEDRITQADFMDIVGRQKALNFRPGTEFLYSNTGFALLALLVQRVSGRSLADFASGEIFGPLEMTDTRFLDNYTTLVHGRAAGYQWQDSGWRLGVPYYDVYGSTNLYTTVDDLLAWTANFSHPRVGDSTIIRQMTTKAVLANGDSIDYGFGLSLGTDHGRRVVEHEGSDPGFRGYLGQYPADSLAVAVLCNTRSVDAVGLGHNLAALFLTPLPAAAPVYNDLPHVELDSLAQAGRAGIYFHPTSIEILELSWRDGHLYTSPRGGRRLDPVGRDSFQMEGEPVLYLFDSRPRSGFVVQSLLPGHHPDRFEWRAPPGVAHPSLLPYAGYYFSPELNASYRVTAADSSVHLQTGSSNGFTAHPVFGDTFASGQIVIQFLRIHKRIAGFQISHPRARLITFLRCSSPAD